MARIWYEGFVLFWKLSRDTYSNLNTKRTLWSRGGGPVFFERLSFAELYLLLSLFSHNLPLVFSRYCLLFSLATPPTAELTKLHDGGVHQHHHALPLLLQRHCKSIKNPKSMKSRHVHYGVRNSCWARETRCLLLVVPPPSLPPLVMDQSCYRSHSLSGGSQSSRGLGWVWHENLGTYSLFETISPFHSLT